MSVAARKYTARAKKTLKGNKDWKEAISSAFPDVDIEKIWEDAAERLAGMYESYADIPRGERMHTDGFIFVAAAVYLAIKDYEGEAAWPFMEKKMREHALKTGASLIKMSRIPGFKRLFIAVWTPVTKWMFGPKQGFTNIFYPCEKGAFRMDITKCPYHDYLEKVGCPEIGILFCKNDEYCYGNIPGMKFERTETLNSGGARCDFYIRITG